MDVNAGEPHRSLLGPLFFFSIYINNLLIGLSSNLKLFADDTSLFISIVNDIDSSTKHLNDNLKQISKWAFQWKMSFNVGPKKQAQEVIFSCKLKQQTHLPLKFHAFSIIKQIPRNI